MLATILFSIIGAFVLQIVYKYRIKDYEEFIKPIFGWKLSKIFEFIITIFLFIGFCVMLAGSGAIFNQYLNLSYNVGIYIMVTCALLTFMFSIKGISTVNNIIVPFLIVGIVTIGAITILKEGLPLIKLDGVKITKTGNWLTSAIFYVSYNSISAIVIMTSLLTIIPTKKDAIKGGIFGGLGLGVLAVFLIMPLLILFTEIRDLEIPMLGVASKIGDRGGLIYTIILWGAMFTTAIANGFSCIKRLESKLKLNFKILSIVFCVATIPIARLGFANLVATLYPVFGYLGFFMLILMTFHFLTN